MEEIILKSIDGEILASSREVAERFHKDHKDVIAKIEGKDRLNRNREVGLVEGILKRGIPLSKYFSKSSYESRGKTYDEYLMTRDGFSLLVMGFTGDDALEWKLKYIDAFNKMEQLLQNRVQKSLPSSYKEAVQQLLTQIEENEKLLEENKELVPKALLVDNMIKNNSSVTTTISQRIRDKDVARRWKRKSKDGELSYSNFCVLEFIHDFINENGYCPTVREIGAGIGISSPASVQLHMNKLNSLGYIVKNHMQKRNTRVNEDKYIEVKEKFDKINNETT